MTTRKATGDAGEALAVAFLESRHGYRIVDTNVRLGSKRDGLGGELDIVAWDGETLCFVEVKTRTVTPETHTESPAEAVSLAKQAQIARLAIAYALRNGFLEDSAEVALRFDIVAVRLTVSRGQEFSTCELIRSAFYAPEE
ncbi:MAG: YraN family protein [Akkermansiaceae bacterium]|nr:YraN family protein [Armatimonadota bacterium]